MSIVSGVLKTPTHLEMEHTSEKKEDITITTKLLSNEPRPEKTGFLDMRKHRRRSGSR